MISPRTHNVFSYASTAAIYGLAYASAIMHAHRVGVTTIAQAWQASSHVQALAWVLWTFHFMRRAVESAFVHKYSAKAMDSLDVFLEYLYYWVFACWIAHAVANERYIFQNPLPEALCLLLWALSQVGNYVFHAQLAALRASDKDTSRYSLPPGLAFRYVCCPHYTCEVLAWVAFVLIAPTRPVKRQYRARPKIDTVEGSYMGRSSTNTYLRRLATGVLFLLVASSIMAVWATYRRRWYLTNVPAFDPKTRAIVPYLL